MVNLYGEKTVPIAWLVFVIALQKPLNMERKVWENLGIIYRRTGIGYRANEKSKN